MGFTLARYVGLSFLAASAVIYHAFATRQHFYRAAIYLSSSKIAVAAMGNLAFALALCSHQLVIKMFLGSLRDIEQEMIRERLSSAVMESLLALTIFREEFSTFFVAMFASLVFIKVMHWLVQDRVDYVEVTPTISLFGHLRIVSFMVLLLALDSAFLQYTIAGTIQSSGQSVMLLFAFEYVILASTIVRYALKYGMSMVDLAMDGNWTGKGTAVFYLELIADLLHLFVYATFFTIVFMHYGLPLHLVRDLYSTFRNFRSRMHDFLRFRQVTARLDRFPDASADDLRRCDGVCIICREEMTEAGSNKRLFCGHVFHLHCLRSWLERQQNCPTCRASVFRRPAAGQQQAQAGPGMAGAALAVPGGEPAAAAAEDADAQHRHPPHAHDAADGAVVWPPVEPHAAAAAAVGSLRHRRVGGANAANAGAAAAPQGEPEASSSAGPSRSSSQPLPAADAAAAAASGSTASRAAPSSLPTAAAMAAGAAAAAGTGTGPSAAAPGTAASAATGEAPAASGGSGGAGASAAGPAEVMLQSALEVLRAEHQCLVQRLIAKRQQAQQQGASVTRLLQTDPWVAAAVAELQQIRARIQQVELALTDFLRTDVESEAGPGLAPLHHHLSYMFLPMGGAAGGAAAASAGGGSAVAAPGPNSGDGAAAAASPYPFIPFMPPFGPTAANASSSASGSSAAFPLPLQQPMQLPPFFGMPPAMVAAPPMMMPFVPVSLPTGTSGGAAAAPAPAAAAGPAIAAIQVPLHHHQLAAAAAAAAASAAAAAMFGAGVFPNGGGMFFVPQPQQQQPVQQAAGPSGVGGSASPAAGEGASVTAAAAGPASADTTVEAAEAPAAPDAEAVKEAAAGSSGATAAEADAAALAEAERVKQEGGAAEPLPAGASPAPAAGDEAAPATVAPAAASGEATEAVEAGAEEDPQEAMRRIRLQRFGQ